MSQWGRSVVVRVVLAAGCLGVVAGAAVPGVSHAATHAKKTKYTFAGKYYVSLGDSYSVGYQPVPAPLGAATSGFTGYVKTALDMNLVNFGCGGATTSSLLDFTGVCGGDESDDPEGYAPPAATDAGTIPPGDSQVQAAVAFMEAHQGQIGLITVSIGGNDVTPCVAASPTNLVNGQSTAIGCVSAGVASIQANIDSVVDQLSAAAPGVAIVGTTYPDVLLGLWVYPTYPASASNLSLAEESTAAFSLLINPALSKAYQSVPLGAFADVTTATGAYGSLAKLKNLKPYGKIPAPVVEVCKLTYYCSQGNIHANTLGYTDIGKLVVKVAKKDVK